MTTAADSWDDEQHSRAESWRSEATACPVCGGAGEIPTGRRERETGVYEADACGFCNGDGCVDPRYIEPHRDYTPGLKYPAGGWI